MGLQLQVLYIFMYIFTYIWLKYGCHPYIYANCASVPHLRDVLLREKMLSFGFCQNFPPPPANLDNMY